MQSQLPMHQSPRCGAKTRSGKPCQAPAVKEKKRCRMHGGKGSGALRGNQNALKHGIYGAQMVAKRLHFAELVKELEQAIKPI